MSNGANQLFDPEAPPGAESVAGADEADQDGAEETAPTPEESGAPTRARSAVSERLAARVAAAERRARSGGPRPDPGSDPRGRVRRRLGVRPRTPSGHPSRCPFYWGSLRAGRACPGPRLPPDPPALGPRGDPSPLGPPFGPSLSGADRPRRQRRPFGPAGPRRRAHAEREVLAHHVGSAASRLGQGGHRADRGHDRGPARLARSVPGQG